MQAGAGVRPTLDELHNEHMNKVIIDIPIKTINWFSDNYQVFKNSLLQ
jgi:hypothetical protein